MNYKNYNLRVSPGRREYGTLEIILVTGIDNEYKKIIDVFLLFQTGG